MPGAELLLFGPSMLIFTAAASLVDWKHHKIPNALVLRILAVSAVLNTVYFATREFGQLFLFLAFVAVSGAASVTLWLLDFWKPGDVKFYTALSTLVHPPQPSMFLAPLLGFIVLSVLATLLEALLTRKVEFRPEPKAGMLLPVALSPMIALLGISSLPAIFIMLFLGSKLDKFKTVIVAAAILSMAVFPAAALKSLAVAAVFFVLASFRFRGRLPSAPFISASFIYLVAIGKI
jgi:Flp pilus assembly protein protease CpaA